MMLKNLMEDKQLNFDQPLLSVRRFSSTATTSETDDKKKIDKPIPKLPPLPFYKSELKSGPIRNPGSVPFVWEQAPGRPKDERKSRPRAPELPPIAPKLPPGRVSNIKQEALDKVSRHTIPTQSQTGRVLSSSKDVLELNKTIAAKDKSSTQGRDENSSSGTEDGDETYLDALDTLSRSESFSMNCSVSGVSGLDGLDVKPSGTFSTDPQTRDFMMGRFLPAAKAMASETPQYAPRKQPVVREQPRQVNKVVNVDKQHLLNPYRPNALPPYAQELGQEESDDESVTYEGSDIMSAKVCGLFPRFCLKNSFCLLNPVPGMKMQSQFPISSGRRVQAKSSSGSSCSETRPEHSEDVVSDKGSVVEQQAAEQSAGKIEVKCKSNEVEEESGSQLLDQPSVNRHQQGSGLSPYHNRYSQSKLPEQKGFLGVPERAKKSRQNGFDIQKSRRSNFRELLTNENTKWETGSGSPLVEKTLYIDSVHTVKSPSANSSSLDTRSFTSHWENNVEIPERSSDTEDACSLDSSLQDIKQLSIVNKKVKVRPKSLESVDSCSPSDSGRSTYEKQKDMKNVLRQNEDLIQDSLLVMSSKMANHENFHSESQHSGKSCDQEKCHDLTKDSITFMSPKVADNKIDLESPQPLGVHNQESFSGHVQNPLTLAHSKMADHKKVDLETQQVMKLGTEKRSDALIQNSTTKSANDVMIDLESQRHEKLGNQESSDGSYFQMPLALPSPKSPSESWLKRALPVVSSRNSRSSLAARIGSSSPVASPLDPKWETIVKTSNLQHGHLRFHEQHLCPIPEA